jgi:glyoxylase-like metal-dependent hydrolase (beta-lactamase superfamily II)
MLSPAGAQALPGLEVLALRTPTLPPATHTNTCLLGRASVWVVDPATPHAAERERLRARLAERAAGGGRLAGIVLTHHHPDHIGAAAWLRDHSRAPIYAHAGTAALLAGRLEIDLLLAEGDVLAGSDAEDDAWHVLHTPGHASGHLVLWQPIHRALVAGDMVAATGTVVIEPPDGHMATYIAQLQRLAALAPALCVPAHGEIIADPAPHFEHYVRHRLAREATVVAALAEGAADLPTLTARSYPEVPRALLALASGSAWAHLIKLQEEGRAHQGPAGTWRSGPAAG